VLYYLLGSLLLSVMDAVQWPEPSQKQTNRSTTTVWRRGSEVSGMELTPRRVDVRRHAVAADAPAAVHAADSHPAWDDDYDTTEMETLSMDTLRDGHLLLDPRPPTSPTHTTANPMYIGTRRLFLLWRGWLWG
jgi:hypothetical protein